VPAEKNYSATELECLGIKWALEHFRYYIYGQRVIVHTDHAALQDAMVRRLTGNRRVEKWAQQISEYDPVIKYKPGKTNPADFLSRIPNAEKFTKFSEFMKATDPTRKADVMFDEPIIKGEDTVVHEIFSRVNEEDDDTEIIDVFHLMDHELLEDYEETLDETEIKQVDTGDETSTSSLSNEEYEDTEDKDEKNENEDIYKLPLDTIDHMPYGQDYHDENEDDYDPVEGQC
jgi:hypothetical protein